jgi:hypothetical protein
LAVGDCGAPPPGAGRRPARIPRRVPSSCVFVNIASCVFVNIARLTFAPRRRGRCMQARGAGRLEGKGGAPARALHSSRRTGGAGRGEGSADRCPPRGSPPDLGVARPRHEHRPSADVRVTPTRRQPHAAVYMRANRWAFWAVRSGGGRFVWIGARRRRRGSDSRRASRHAAGCRRRAGSPSLYLLFLLRLSVRCDVVDGEALRRASGLVLFVDVVSRCGERPRLLRGPFRQLRVDLAQAVA